MRVLISVLATLNGCAHITSVAPAPSSGEFYVITERYNPLGFPSIPQGYVLRCWAVPDGSTTCVRVLQPWEAGSFYTRDSDGPTRFGGTKTH